MYYVYDRRLSKLQNQRLLVQAHPILRQKHMQPLQLQTEAVEVVITITTTLNLFFVCI